MPSLDLVRLSHFRNIVAAELDLSPTINLIYGENGAGKSSLLEAISVLSIGRSFRTRKFRRLIEEGVPTFQVFSRFTDDTEEQNTLGIERSRSGDSKFRLNSKNINTSAELAKALPSLVIDAHSFQLLEGGAKQRRMFFDWLVFHVKHSFAQLWFDYSKCLKQRNNLLKHDKMDYTLVEPWDKELGRLSKEIALLRSDCFNRYNALFNSVYSAADGADTRIKLEYSHGWDQDIDLAKELKANFIRDCHLGYTNIGPHKAELKIRCGTTPAVEVLSRGQQKLLVCALYITEAIHYQEQCQRKAIMLIDDMPAELDKHNQQTLCGWLKKQGLQCFITGIQKESLCKPWEDTNTNIKMFHVKHGEIFPEIY